MKKITDEDKQILKEMVDRYSVYDIEAVFRELKEELWNNVAAQRKARREKEKSYRKNVEAKQELHGLQLIHKLKPGMVVEVRGTQYNTKYRLVTQVKGQSIIGQHVELRTRQVINDPSGEPLKYKAIKKTYFQRGKYITEHLAKKLVKIVDTTDIPIED